MEHSPNDNCFAKLSPRIICFNLYLFPEESLTPPFPKSCKNKKQVTLAHKGASKSKRQWFERKHRAEQGHGSVDKVRVLKESLDPQKPGKGWEGMAAPPPPPRNSSTQEMDGCSGKVNQQSSQSVQVASLDRDTDVNL